MTRNQLNNFADDISSIYEHIEYDLLMNIARKFETGKDLIKVVDEKSVKYDPQVTVLYNDWQMQMLKDMNGFTKENAEIIARYSGKTVAEVSKIFDEATYLGLKADEELMSKAAKVGVLKTAENIKSDKIVKALLTIAKKDALTTLNVSNNTMLYRAGETYRKIVNNISSQVISGTKTYNQALADSIITMNKEGIPAFVDKVGRQWSPEGYLNMVIKTDLQNTINTIQDERLQQYGNDYIEINAYAGARPKCSQDQGKIYSLSGNSKGISDLNGLGIKVYDWNNSTYGEPDGILGINCGHSRHAFVPGFSVYRKAKINKQESDDLYKLNQQQRAYEREIRKTKREISLLKQDDLDTTETANKLKQEQSRMKQFVECNDLVRRYDREKIY